MHRIIVLDKLAREGLDRLASAEDVSHEVHTGLSGDSLRDALLEFDGAICRSEAKITADTLKGNRRLRGIVRAGVGTDNIDRTAATRQGIVVMNTPTGNTLSTAEHTFTLIAALSRNIAPASRSLVEGRWERGAFTGVQLAGKTLGIIGMGRIGREVATRAKAFAMRVIGFDPFLSPEQAEKLGVEYTDDVRELLPEVDYLTVHAPDAGDAPPGQPRRNRPAQTGRAAGQLRPGRNLRRGSTDQGPRKRETGWRGAGRLRRRTLRRQPPAPHARRIVYAPSRREHGRGAG